MEQPEPDAASDDLIDQEPPSPAVLAPEADTTERERPWVEAPDAPDRPAVTGGFAPVGHRQDPLEDDRDVEHSDAFALLEADSDLWTTPWSDEPGEVAEVSEAAEDWGDWTFDAEAWSGADRELPVPQDDVPELEHASMSVAYARDVIDDEPGRSVQADEPVRMVPVLGLMADSRDYYLPEEQEQEDEEQQEEEPEVERTSKDLLHQSKDAWGTSYSDGWDDGGLG